MGAAGVDYLAVAIAAVAAFAFGSIYYMTLGRAWLAALGRSPASMKTGSPPPAALITTFVAEFVMAWVLAQLPRSPGLVGGLAVGFLMWLGFVMTTLLVNHAYQGSKHSLTLIDGAHWLGVLLIQGAILGEIV